mmetsp:Transcript_41362/g.92505  ORF Transcript_41362/g.92505 Transcript_41362/m.92505 type:complete len:324 (+) Transcript_41362:2-973(+)
MCFAFEDAEDYIMKVPPRDVKTSMVLTRSLVCFRWLPFVLYFPAVVYGSLCFGTFAAVGSVRNDALVGSSGIHDLEEGRAVCEHAGWELPNGDYKRDSRPFHCRCQVSQDGIPTQPKTSLEQWGTSQELEVDPSFDPLQRREIFSFHGPDWNGRRAQAVKPCGSTQNAGRWCWQESVQKSRRPVLPPGASCAEHGVKVGQTMALVTIMLGEVLTLMSFRTDGCFVFSLCRNQLYNVSLLLNICVMMTFVYRPELSSVLDLVPLPPLLLATAAAFATALVVLNETVKILYRLHLSRVNSSLEAEALARAAGCNSEASPRGNGDP